VSDSRPKARLVGQTGELAGTSFDLGESTTIGTRESHDIVIPSPTLSPDHARIVFEDGAYRLEDLGSSHGIRLDGAPVNRPMRLDRIHVVELSESLELVFIQEAETTRDAPAQTQAEPPPPKPPEPERPEPSRPPEGPDPSHTVVDRVGFGALPDQFQQSPGETSREEEEDGEEARREPARDEPEPEAEGADDPGHTVVDMRGFGPLPPQVQKEPRDTPPDEVKEPEEPVRDQPETQEPPDAGATRVSPVSAMPDPPRRIRLEVTPPEGQPLSFDLDEGEHVMGRGQACEITVPDPEMWLSREHAVIRVRKDSIELEDLKSINGTFVQGRKIERVSLEPGASFSLGPHLNFTLREP